MSIKSCCCQLFLGDDCDFPLEYREPVEGPLGGICILPDLPWIISRGGEQRQRAAGIGNDLLYFLQGSLVHSKSFIAAAAGLNRKRAQSTRFVKIAAISTVFDIDSVVFSAEEKLQSRIVHNDRTSSLDIPQVNSARISLLYSVE